MPVKTISAREFHQNTAGASRAAEDGPVIVTKRGRPSLVLLKFDEYNKIAAKPRSIADLLSCPEAAEIDFDPPRLNFTPRPVDFD